MLVVKWQGCSNGNKMIYEIKYLEEINLTLGGQWKIWQSDIYGEIWIVWREEPLNSWVRWVGLVALQVKLLPGMPTFHMGVNGCSMFHPSFMLMHLGSNRRCPFPWENWMETADCSLLIVLVSLSLSHSLSLSAGYLPSNS